MAGTQQKPSAIQGLIRSTLSNSKAPRVKSSRTTLTMHALMVKQVKQMKVTMPTCTQKVVARHVRVNMTRHLTLADNKPPGWLQCVGMHDRDKMLI